MKYVQYSSHSSDRLLLEPCGKEQTFYSISFVLFVSFYFSVSITLFFYTLPPQLPGCATYGGGDGIPSVPVPVPVTVRVAVPLHAFVQVPEHVPTPVLARGPVPAPVPLHILVLAPTTVLVFAACTCPCN